MRRLLNLEVILLVLCVVGFWFGATDPLGWLTTPDPQRPDWHKASCYKIPERYHGGLYCSDQETGGNHGYVNPGSNEWEVE